MRYVLLRKQALAPRATDITTIPELVPGSLVAVDFETKGTLAWQHDFEVITVGLANEHGAWALDWRTMALAARRDLLQTLCQCRLIAFNTYFDAAAMSHLLSEAGLPRPFPWVGDSYHLFKAGSTEGWAGQRWGLDTAIRDVLGWDVNSKATMDALLAAKGLDKSTMWQLSHEEIGPYCASDADAAWQLWHSLQEQLAKFPQLLNYHRDTFMPQVRMWLEQLFQGIQIDQARLERCETQLRAATEALRAQFLGDPRVKAFEYLEPPMLTKSGAKTGAWIAWNKARRAGEVVPLNLNSKPQLARFFFEHLGLKPRLKTESGAPSVSKKVLPGLGDLGKTLAEYNKLTKRQGYVQGLKAALDPEFVVRPQFNTAGTVTLRPGGTGGFNLLQMPKDSAFLASFVARPGHKLVQADFEALEPTILAMFSQCRTLLSVYGAGVPQNDVYLLTAALIPALGKEIVKYYDPKNPTPEGIKAAKEHCKRDRGIAKTVHLASVYGASARKIHETLTLEGVDISMREVQVIHREYWHVYRDVKRFQAHLEEMHAASGGWIPSAIGTPVAVDPKFTKDIVNRFCQYSGSIVLQTFTKHIDKLRRERNVPMLPWNLNMYDESIWQVPEERAEDALTLFRDALVNTNAELNFAIPFKAPPMLADNLAQIKTPDTYERWMEAYEIEE